MKVWGSTASMPLTCSPSDIRRSAVHCHQRIVLSANQVAVAFGVEHALGGTVGRGTVREPAGDTPENLCRLD
jgi:hypothetical protein